MPVLIEIDCDGHRSGWSRATRAASQRSAALVVAGGASLRGVLLHAGDSYAASDPDALAAAAEAERARGRRLRRRSARGRACPVRW